jgi:hypothetical protein
VTILVSIWKGAGCRGALAMRHSEDWGGLGALLGDRRLFCLGLFLHRVRVGAHRTLGDRPLSAGRLQICGGVSVAVVFGVLGEGFPDSRRAAGA